MRKGQDIIGKTAAKHIAKAVGGHVSQALLNTGNLPTPQEGSGLIDIHSKKKGGEKESITSEPDWTTPAF